MRPVVRTLGVLAVLAALAGCAAVGSSRASGPFLRPGPLGPDNGGVPRAPGSWAAGVTPSGPAAASARLPAGFSAGGRAPLPGARLAAIGAYRALVVPLSLGTAMPALSEEVLSAGYFGAPGMAGTLGDALYRESGGAFRMTADVLPLLVHPEPSFDRRAPAGGELETLIRRALESWGRERDLSVYDNDGPDGIPGSPDDDGTLDLVWVVLETPHALAPFTLARGFEVTSAGRRIRTGPIHVLPAPGAVLPDLRVPLDQTLATLGVAPSERFFPAGYPRTVATVARARLGWLPVAPFAGGGEADLADGRAFLLPLSDLSVDAGFWLVERMREHVLTSRIALRPDRAYQVTDSVHWSRGAEQVLPLSYHLGAHGPTVLVRWEASQPAPRVDAGAAYAGASGHLPSAPQTGEALVRTASEDTPGSHRWLRLGTDSVRVAVGGPPLTLP
jgi:hypothetical protein